MEGEIGDRLGVDADQVGHFADGGTGAVVAGGPEKESGPGKAARPATGETSAAAAAADKSERAGGKGRPPPPMAEGAKAVAAAKPEQVSRPARPALPPTREVGTAAAGAVQQASGASGSCSSYKIPRLLSPIQGGYMENFLVYVVFVSTRKLT